MVSWCRPSESLLLAIRNYSPRPIFLCFLALTDDSPVHVAFNGKTGAASGLETGPS